MIISLSINDLIATANQHMIGSVTRSYVRTGLPESSDITVALPQQAPT